MENQSTITVISPVDGKRFRMTMKGDVSRLTVRKMKRYLVTSCGVPAEEQILKYNGVELGEDVMGGEVGIASGSTLTVERRTGPAVPFVASPTKQALEMETLDQQKTMLQHERMRREEEFRRHQDSLKVSQAAAEKRRIDLERERLEKEAELKRLAEIEESADAERRRLAAVRAAEGERESARVRDLDMRKQQLGQERDLQRQLEMQKLENERKKMLLQQQQAEYEAERARLDRERRDYEERIKKEELRIREREVDLERQQMDAERSKKELEMEKHVLSEQRNLEYDKLQQSRTVDFSVNATSSMRHASPSASQRMGRTNTSAAAPTTPRIASKERELDELRALRAASEVERTREIELDRLIAAERSALDTTAPVGTPAAAAPLESPAAAPAQPIRQPSPAPLEGRGPATGDARDMALEQLRQLAEDIGVPTLQLDDNNTCVVSVEDKYTLLITFDASTERIYLYSTLSTFIPKDPATKLRLYEFLLEGALLGRDMCGGGVGASLKNDFILMSTSVYLPKAAPTALRSIVPMFVDVLVRWRNRVKDLLRDSGEYINTETASEVSMAPTAASASIARPDGQEQPLVGLEVTDGVVVDGVYQRYADGVVVVNTRGPAQRAGLLANDFIRSVNGRKVTSLKEFQDTVRALKSHSTVPFGVDRAGSQLVISVLIGSSSARPGDARHKNPVRVTDQPAVSPSASISRSGGHVY